MTAKAAEAVQKTAITHLRDGLLLEFKQVKRITPPVQARAEGRQPCGSSLRYLLCTCAHVKPMRMRAHCARKCMQRFEQQHCGQRRPSCTRAHLP